MQIILALVREECERSFGAAVFWLLGNLDGKLLFFGLGFVSFSRLHLLLQSSFVSCCCEPFVHSFCFLFSVPLLSRQVHLCAKKREEKKTK